MKKNITKISDLRPQETNANKHNTFGLRLLEESIQRDGYIDGMTAAADGEIISGSARLGVAAEKFVDKDGNDVDPIIVHTSGDRPVVVIRDDIPNAKHARAKRLSVAANAIAAADWNPDYAILKSWAGEDEQIKKLFSDDEWREGTGEEPETVDAEPQIDRAAELQVKWQTETGQLWKLGAHRLLIGDCTVRENVERLMGGERADMCFTSPPYGSKSGNLSGVKFYGTKDKDTFDDYVGFLCDFLSVVPVNNNSPVLVNLSYNDNQRKALFEFAVSDKHGFELYETFIWKKIRSMPLKGDNISRLCEFVFLFSKDRYKIYNREVINLGLFNFYETKKENSQSREGGNLATFPVDFPEHFINLFSLQNHLIYEPFCGTGTTIIAAHDLGRRCYAMEISPAYCAVILQRFSDAFPNEKIEQMEDLQ